jgi:hypothetical protein
MWTMVWWYRLGLTPRALPERSGSHQYSGGPVSRYISGESRRRGEGNENLVSPSPWDFKRFLTCRKILRHGTSGFTSHPKECVLRIFIALKNPSPWPGSTFGSSGKYTNRYITEATISYATIQMKMDHMALVFLRLQSASAPAEFSCVLKEMQAKERLC